MGDGTLRGNGMPGSDEPSFQSFIEDLQSNSLTYEDAKRRYAELGDRIRNRYEREITAVSLDVVDSRGLKQRGAVIDAQLTFDAFHDWVEEELKNAGCGNGQWTWSGDGLLAIFEHAEAAVRVSRQLIEDLSRFNVRSNRLRDAPLQLRIGVHTGPIITTDQGGMSSAALGKIASDTVDLAGHLQKSALPNQVLISQTTYTKLREGGGQFARVERELPNPATCFAFPPHTALLPPPPPREPTLQGANAYIPPPVEKSGPSGWGLAVGVGGVAVAIGVIAAVVVLRPQLAGRSQNSTSTPLVVRQQPPPGSSNPIGSPGGSASPDSPSSGGASSGGVTPGPGAPPPPGPGKTPTEWSPATTLWRSPDADSGVPARLTESPPDLRWILSIGVGAYQDPAFTAEGAGRDAQLVAQALQSATQTPTNHVQVLADGNATLAAIKQAFGWIQGNARSGRDTVYVYLSGVAIPTAARAYALAAADATAADPRAVSGAEIAAWLGATHAQTIVVFADTPYAGAMETPNGTDQGRQYALLAATGSAQGSNAREGQSSVFSNSLIAGLQGGDANRDGRTSLEELQQFLRAEVNRRSNGAQTPEARPGFGGYLPEIHFSP